MSQSIEDIEYRVLTDEPSHLDAALIYRLVVSPDYTSDCLYFGYQIRLFTQMQGISDFNNLEEKYEVCKDQPPVSFKLFHEQYPVTKYGVFARDAVILKDNARLDSITGGPDDWSPVNDCRVYSNTLISAEDYVVVEGSLYAPNIDLSTSATYTGTMNGLDTPLPWFETEVGQAFDLAEQINDNNQTGETSGLFKTSAKKVIELDEGLYYVRNLKLAGQTTLALNGRVIIFSEGDVVLSGSCQINAEGDPINLAIYSSENITCSDEVVLNGHLHAFSGEIQCTNNALIRGSMTARTITMSGSTRFYQLENNDDQALSFGVLSVKNELDETEDKTVLFQAHKNSILMTKKLDVEDGSFVWRENRGKKDGSQQVKTSKGYISNLKGYTEHNLLIEHRVLEKVVFDELENTYDNVRDSILRWTEGAQSGYLNFTRQWAYHWSVFNEDMNSNNGGPYHCCGDLDPCGESMTQDAWDHRFSYQPFGRVGEQGNGWGIFCPTKVALVEVMGTNPYEQRGYYNSYAGRMKRLLGDLQNVGVVVQIDLFDHCMPYTGKWYKNPYNLENQAQGTLVTTIPCVNDMNSITSVEEFCSLNTSKPILYQQQEFFIGKIVGFCKTQGFSNVFFDVINEGHYWNQTTADWYDSMVAKVHDTDNDTLISINVYPDLSTHSVPGGKTVRQWYREILKDYLLANMDEEDNIDIISYHFPFWSSNDGTAFYITDLITWHNNNIGPRRAVIIDDDGGQLAREDNDDVGDWAREAAETNNRCFIHKDKQHYCKNAFGVEIFMQDNIAKKMIDTTP